MTSVTVTRPRAALVGLSSPHPLSRQECWDHLRRLHEGRLSYLSGRGERCVVVPYVLSGRAVVLRIPPYNEATGYARGRRVAFEVQQRLDEHRVVRVQAGGRAHVVRHRPHAADDLPEEGWPGEHRSSVLVVDVEQLAGVVQLVGSP